MCCEGKCFGCIKVEVGSLIFGVFSAVLWFLGILVCVIMLVLVNVFNDRLGIIDSYDPVNSLTVTVFNDRLGTIDSYSSASSVTVAMFNAIAGSLLAVGLLNFFFSVLLCDGINKRNTAHIKAYFIYGIVTTILATLVVIVIGIVSSIVLIILGIPIVIYCFILHMINLTMQQFAGGQVFGYSHKLLVETNSVRMA